MKIYIDVGHGKTGSDSGASAVSGKTTYYENDRNLKIATAVAQVLASAGHSPKLSRDSNVDIGNLVGKYNRADSNLINSAHAVTSDYDFMISIHCNDSSDSSSRGLWLTGKNDELSKKLLNAVEDGFHEDYVPHQHSIPLNAVYSKWENYGILRLHNRPGILIECGFMSNSKDLHEILCNSYGIGKCIADSILKVIEVDKFSDLKAELDKIELSIETIRKIIENA